MALVQIGHLLVEFVAVQLSVTEGLLGGPILLLQILVLADDDLEVDLSVVNLLLELDVVVKQGFTLI